MTRIESASILKGMIDQYGPDWVIKILINDYEDKIQAYKGSGDRVVISWHDLAVKRKALLGQLIEDRRQATKDHFDHESWYAGFKSE